MERFLFEYEMISEGETRQFAFVETCESDAWERAAERIADIEFTDVEDIKVTRLLEVSDDDDNYFECEACT